jgi:hypothetical protein
VIVIVEAGKFVFETETDEAIYTFNKKTSLNLFLVNSVDVLLPILNHAAFENVFVDKSATPDKVVFVVVAENVEVVSVELYIFKIEFVAEILMGKTKVGNDGGVLGRWI